MIFEMIFEGKMDSRIFHAAISTITTACFMLRYKNVKGSWYHRSKVRVTLNRYI